MFIEIQYYIFFNKLFKQFKKDKNYKYKKKLY